MNRKALEIAEQEARRFLKRVEALPKPIKVENPAFREGYYMSDHFPKESGAVRRASMDLTRALADLRRPL